MIKYLAMIAAWTGDKNLTCQQLTIVDYAQYDKTAGLFLGEST